MTAQAHLTAVTGPPPTDLAVMLTGGGARAAYQVGLLKGIAKHFPRLRFDIITGVSAGAINAIYLAAKHGTLAEKSERLAEMWCELDCSHIFRFDWQNLMPFRSALASVFPKKRWTRSRPHGIVDTTPLRDLLCRVLGVPPGWPIPGIADRIREGDLKAVALMSLDYSTGQSVRWVQGRDFAPFDSVTHRGEQACMTVEHVLASSALPFVFPAVQVGNEWHGDGGIRLAAPLSPAVHLGATRIIAMSTGYQQKPDDVVLPEISGYPPAAQILGQLVNSIFLDAIDEDVLRMERMNRLLRKMDPRDRDGLRPIELLVLRPSIDLGKLAAQYEKYLPRNLKLMFRALGVKETDSPDFVSMLMFEPHFTRHIIEIGEQDVEGRIGDLRAFLAEDAGYATATY